MQSRQPTQKNKKNFLFLCGFALPASPIAYKAANRKPGIGNKRIVGTESVVILHMPRMLAIAVALLLCAVPGRVLAESEQPSQTQRYEIDIPALNAAAALNELAAQTGVTFLFPYDQAKTRQANAVKGRYTIINALKRLLKGSGLSSGLSDKGVLMISAKESEENDNERKETMKAKKSLLATVIGFLTSSITTHHVFAENEGNPGEKLTPVLEEVIVTAQKREQNLQDTPISISAFSGTSLEQKGIDNTSDLQNYVPGLTYGRTDGAGAQISIRGIGGSIGFGVGHDPGVATHIDGHYIHNTAYLTQDFLDIERIEVLRGPQGTLYGKNAVGGTINIITNKPTDQLEGKAGVEIGNYNQRKLRGVINLPITKDLATRLAIAAEDRDGYTKNIENGQDLDNSDYYSIRGSVLYTPTQNVEILISGYDYRNKRTNPFHLIHGYPDQETLPNFLGEQIPNPWQAPQVGINPAVNNHREIGGLYQQHGNDKAHGGSIDVEWTLGSYTVRSLSSYNSSESLLVMDASNSKFVPILLTTFTPVDTISQELQLIYDGGDRIKWISGIHYYEEESIFDFGLGSYDLMGGLLGDGLTRLDSFNGVETKSAAVFSQLDHQVTDKLELTYGIRYSRDKKDYSQALSIDLWDGAENYQFVDFGKNPNLQSDEWSKTTGRLAANYLMNEDVTIFASAATGYTAGGFNGSNPFDPESVTAYETGIKTALWDRQMQLNLAGFYNDYKDKQERQTLNNQTFVRNAAAAKVYGIEAEILARPSEALVLTALIGYMNARYDKFLGAVSPKGGFVDASNNVIPRSPDWKINLGIAYTWDMAEAGSLTARTNFSWVDEIHYHETNDLSFKEGSYHRTDLRLIWDNLNNSWTATLFINNIENDDVVENFSIFSESYGSAVSAKLKPPRTYGMSVDYKF